jgi:hypothetical protein
VVSLQKWQSKPFRPEWLEALTMQSKGDLTTYDFWLKANIPLMSPGNRQRAKLMRSAIKQEVFRRKEVKWARKAGLKARRAKRTAAANLKTV